MSDRYRLLTDGSELAEACERLARAGAVAVDTEFKRERTYRPELCVVQLAVPGEHVLIDGIALEDLEPLRRLFADPGVEKVLHSARQDLEIFWSLWEELPQPLFDTQVAAALLGHGDNLGYGAIVKALLGIELEKAHARTDWTRRPLSEAQLAYAADDVIHLIEVHGLLAERLDEEGRRDWHRAEAERLRDPALYRAAPELAWKTVKGHARTRGDERRVVRALAAWRERRAEKRDKPRRWILSDEAVLELARHRPEDQRGLDRMDSLPEGLRRRQGGVLLDVIDEALEGPAPPAEPRARGGRPEPDEQELLDKLAAEVREAAEKHGVAPSLLAPRADLLAIVREGAEAGVPVLEGWRRELVGDALLALATRST
jgi:ribonuclease D